MRGGDDAGRTLVRSSAANAGWYGRAKNKKMMRIERRTKGISCMADVLPLTCLLRGLLNTQVFGHL